MKRLYQLTVFLVVSLATVCAAHAHVPDQLASDQSESFALLPSVHESAELDFRKVSGSSYLAMAVPYEPISSLREEFTAANRLNLKNRGEAHITVVSPPEFAILKSKLSMSDIIMLAETSDIQETPFQALCVGAGHKNVGGRQLDTYFVVVQSSGLLALREKISDTFTKRGGQSGLFKPEYYFPHITIGFTQRDLHIEDGVKKDRSSCVANVSEQG